MSERIFDNEKIAIAPLDSKPEFYESLTDNPVAEIIADNRNVYNNLARLAQVIEIDQTFPIATDIGLGIASVTQITRNHKVKKGAALPYVYTPLIAPLLVASAVSADEDTIYLSVSNFGVARNFKFTINVYELLQRT